jgi:hypothetical protein
MDLTPSKKVYTLFLNSVAGFRGLIPAISVSPNNVSWNVDYDALFNRDNYIYKNCVVRVNFSGFKNSGTTNSQVDGLLVANFGQNFTGKNVGGVVLGNFEIFMAYEYNGSSYVEEGLYPVLNTMDDAQGQQIDMPYGLNTLNLQMWRPGFGAVGSAGNTLITNPPAYNITLQFELS